MFSLSALHFGSSFGKDSFLRVVHFVEFVEIKVRSLDDFDLSDFHVLDGIYGTDLFGDLLFNNFTGEEVEDLSRIGFRDFLGNDLVDFSSDDFLL